MDTRGVNINKLGGCSRINSQQRMPGGLRFVRSNAQLLPNEFVQQRRLTYIRLSGYRYGAAFSFQASVLYQIVWLYESLPFVLQQGVVRREWLLPFQELQRSCRANGELP